MRRWLLAGGLGPREGDHLTCDEGGQHGHEGADDPRAQVHFPICHPTASLSPRNPDRAIMPLARAQAAPGIARWPPPAALGAWYLSTSRARLVALRRPHRALRIRTPSGRVADRCVPRGPLAGRAAAWTVSRRGLLPR